MPNRANARSASLSGYDLFLVDGEPRMRCNLFPRNPTHTRSGKRLPRCGSPSANGSNGTAKAAAVPAGDGRDGSGRFAKGNKGGPGNPFARRVGRLRSALLEVVTEEKLKA